MKKRKTFAFLAAMMLLLCGCTSLQTRSAEQSTLTEESQSTAEKDSKYNIQTTKTERMLEHFYEDAQYPKVPVSMATEEYLEYNDSKVSALEFLKKFGMGYDASYYPSWNYTRYISSQGDNVIVSFYEFKGELYVGKIQAESTERVKKLIEKYYPDEKFQELVLKDVDYKYRKEEAVSAKDVFSECGIPFYKGSNENNEILVYFLTPYGGERFFAIEESETGLILKPKVQFFEQADVEKHTAYASYQDDVILKSRERRDVFKLVEESCRSLDFDFSAKPATMEEYLKIREEAYSPEKLFKKFGLPFDSNIVEKGFHERQEEIELEYYYYSTDGYRIRILFQEVPNGYLVSEVSAKKISK